MKKRALGIAGLGFVRGIAESTRLEQIVGADRVGLRRELLLRQALATAATCYCYYRRSPRARAPRRLLAGP
jgi:hypothetical protein